MNATLFSDAETESKRHTNGATSEEIHRRLRSQLFCYANANPEEITRRLYELDNEWSLERANQAAGAGLVLFGVVMSVIRRRWWILVPAVLSGFLLQHTLRGWSPPLSLLRRLHLRTLREIDEERQALKVLRGDYADIPVLPQNDTEKVNRILEIVRR
jgi:hypothetical protein